MIAGAPLPLKLLNLAICSLACFEPLINFIYLYDGEGLFLKKILILNYIKKIKSGCRKVDFISLRTQFHFFFSLKFHKKEIILQKNKNNYSSKYQKKLEFRSHGKYQ